MRQLSGTGTSYWTAGSLQMSLPAPNFGSLTEADFLDWMRQLRWHISGVLPDPGGEERNSRYVRHLDRSSGVLLDWTADVWRWEAKVALPHDLTGRYEQLGLVQSGRPQLLHEACSRASGCWAGCEERKAVAPHAEWAHLSRPWIGSRYGALRLVAVGINPYEAGGLDLLQALIPEAQGQIEAGQRKTIQRLGYPGTLLFHRVGVYLARLVMQFGPRDEEAPAPTPATAFEWAAFLNHVKCSPLGDRSQPSEAMWASCGRHILREELTILQPRLLLVLGNGDNLWALSNRVLDREPVLLGAEGQARALTGELEGRKIGMISVPHTSAFGGTRESLADEVTRLARAFQNQLGFRRPF